MVPGFMRLLTLMSPDREMKKQMEELIKFKTQGLKYVSTNMNCTMQWTVNSKILIITQGLFSDRPRWGGVSQWGDSPL